MLLYVHLSAEVIAGMCIRVYFSAVMQWCSSHVSSGVCKVQSEAEAQVVSGHVSADTHNGFSGALCM